MSKEVTEKATTSVALASRFNELPTTGWEEVGAQDLAVPYIRILQSGSPQLKKADGAYIPEASEGDIFNTVQNCIYDGEKGIEVIPAYYNRRYVEWIPRTNAGGGFVGSHPLDTPLLQESTPNEKGVPTLQNGNELVNTSNFYCLLVINGQATPVLIPMSSSGIKKAKQWVSMAHTQTYRSENGSLEIQPLFNNVYKLSAVSESNSNGSWMNWAVEHVRELDIENTPEDSTWFDLAFGFAKSVVADEIRLVDTPEETQDISDNAVM